jgi:hypothetical protein
MDRVIQPNGENNDTPTDEQSTWMVNILIFDIQSFGYERDFLQSSSSALERYQLLRVLEDPRSAAIMSSNMKVQWVGHLQALVDFDSKNRDSLPHIMECYIQLGNSSPCNIHLIRRANSAESMEVDAA